MSTVGRVTTHNPLFCLDQHGGNRRQNDRPARDHRHLTVAEVDKLMTAAKSNVDQERLF